MKKKRLLSCLFRSDGLIGFSDGKQYKTTEEEGLSKRRQLKYKKGKKDLQRRKKENLKVEALANSPTNFKLYFLCKHLLDFYAKILNRVASVIKERYIHVDHFKYLHY